MAGIKLKVCGMRESTNINEVVHEVAPNYLGFIFYDKSPRSVEGELDVRVVKNIPKNIKKIAVVVNKPIHEVIEIAQNYHFEYIQLHGDETIDDCKILKEKGFGVIKVFSVGEAFDFSQLENYQKYVDFFLFDTKGKGRGGNGITFNWKILKNYSLKTPLFLSGGVDEENIVELEELDHLNIHAIDVNSKFETKPALKDISKLKLLKTKLDEINTNGSYK